MTDEDFDDLRRDAARWRELSAMIQAAYDNDGDDTDDLRVTANMVFGCGDYRRVEVGINFADTRDEPVDLGSALDARIAARNAAPTPST